MAAEVAPQASTATQVNTVLTEHSPACTRCENPLNPTGIAVPRDSSAYVGGGIYETLETVHAVVEAIFRALRSNSQGTTQQPHRYVDTHSKSPSPFLHTDRNPRPCVVMADYATKEEAAEALEMCVMATFWSTVDIRLLPSVLRFFVVPIWPHIAILIATNMHLHTTPDWPEDHNQWLIAFRHKTTSYRVGPRWSLRGEQDHPYVFDTPEYMAIDDLCEKRLNRWFQFAARYPRHISKYYHGYKDWAAQERELEGQSQKSAYSFQAPGSSGHSKGSSRRHSDASINDDISLPSPPGLANASKRQGSFAGSQADAHSMTGASSATHSSLGHLSSTHNSRAGSPKPAKSYINNAGQLSGPPSPMSYSQSGPPSPSSYSPGSSSRASPIDGDFPPLSPQVSRKSHSSFQPSPLRSASTSQSFLPQLRPVSQAESQDGGNGALEETVKDLRGLDLRVKSPSSPPSPAELGVTPAVPRRPPTSFADAASRAVSTTPSAATSRSDVAQSHLSQSRTTLSSSANVSANEQDGTSGSEPSRPGSRSTGRGRMLRGAPARLKERINSIIHRSS